MPDITNGGSVSASDIEGPSPLIVKIQSDTKVQLRTIMWIGIIITILCVGGFLTFFYCPDKSEKIWTTIAPIILAAVTGVLGFLAGEKSGARTGKIE